MSSSKDTQSSSSSGLKPKEKQPPKVNVNMRDIASGELRLPPVNKHTSKPESPWFGSTQDLSQMKGSKKK